MRYFIYLSLVMLLLVGGCADENSNATFGAHPADWLDAHPGDIVLSTESFISECGSCHGLDLQGNTGAPSCFSATYGSNSCHATGPVPHELDGSYLLAANHGPEAKADLTACQACHSDNPDGGPGSNPLFNQGIDSAGGSGCQSSGCHPAGYAHPDAWPRPYLDPGPLNDRYHYSAGNIQQACTLCHGTDFTGGTGSSCLDCHLETDNFTLDCSACHAMPPNGSFGIDHATSAALTEPTVADISAHDTCTVCHGLNESASLAGGFSPTGDYTLFNKTSDTLGDHRNHAINMNSDTGYNETTGGCDSAGCHVGDAPYRLPPSSLPVELGAYGIGVSHDTGASWLLPSAHVTAWQDNNPPCFDCHNVTTGGIEPTCQSCHTEANPTVDSSGCTSCHGVPPNSGEHGGDHSPFGCDTCHFGFGTTSLDHWYPNPAPPADIRLDPNDNQIEADFVINTDAAGNVTTCANTCHGEDHGSGRNW